MKKFFILLFVTCLYIVSFAQNKKIAILETSCRENNISSGYLMMIGSNIETGIIKNPNYTAFNRTQVDELLQELNFQQSGLVKDSDIRKIGQMAGVDYVLVSEAVKLEDDLFVTAKVLNVESGKYEMSANELMNFSPQKIQDGCSALARKLLNNGIDPDETNKKPSYYSYDKDRKNGSDAGNGIAARAGLTAYWTFDDGSGRDVTGNGYNGRKVGNILYITDTPKGKGKAIQLLGDGSANRYFYTQENISTSVFSIAFWIKDFGSGNLFKLYKENDYYVNFCVFHNNHQFGLYSEKRRSGTSPTKNTFKFNVSANDLLSSGWHHIAVSVNEGNMQLFIDGDLVEQSNGYYLRGNTKVYFGAGGPVMKLDNVRIYNNYVLSPDEVKQIYNYER